MTSPLLSAVGVTAEERTAIQRTQAEFDQLVALANPEYLHQEASRPGRGDWDSFEELVTGKPARYSAA